MHKWMFCPSKYCKNHNRQDTNRWYKKAGSYETKAFGTVQRYKCNTCGRQFSDQTFSVNFAVKKVLDLNDILYRISACSGIRAAARYYKVTDKVITNRIKRISNQVIGLMIACRNNHQLNEYLVADGFESFVLSQFFPDNIHLLTGKDSQYLYCADYTPIRRKGRMTEKQKQRRIELEERYKPPGGALKASFERICHSIDDIFSRSKMKRLTIHTDEKTAYIPIIKDLAESSEMKITHIMTSGKEERGIHSNLFSVNYYDRELRKDQANHVRETTRWSKNVNNLMSRLSLHTGYHNYFKPHRINSNSKKTHAQVSGVDEKVLRGHLKTFFTRRYFFSKLALNISEWKLWLQTYVTPLKTGMEYIPAYIVQ